MCAVELRPCGAGSVVRKQPSVHSGEARAFFGCDGRLGVRDQYGVGIFCCYAAKKNIESPIILKPSAMYKVLDTVVLDRNLPEYGLRRGDLGAVVQVYEPDGLEVEFVTASGKTQALVTLNVRDVRPVQDSDLITVRSVA